MEEKNWLERLELLLGKEAIEKLNKSRVAIFGIGGVGSWAAEALVRSGIGNIILVDEDVVQLTNLNRQVMANRENVGCKKALVMQKRMQSIALKSNIIAKDIFYLNQELEDLGIDKKYIIIDAIDSVKSKVNLLINGYNQKIPLFSSMGAGQKKDAQKLVLKDISKTHTCPLARTIRRELAKNGIKKGITTVFSEEKPQIQNSSEFDYEYKTKRKNIGSMVTVTATAGLLLAQAVIEFILDEKMEIN